jgi:CheY-like chemotaxis protein
MRKMLIADPSEETGRMLKELFCREYQVFTCTGGTALLQQLKTLRPDILILELSLPEIDGLQVLRQAHQILPPVILATTTNQKDHVLYQAAELGVGQVLTRPYFPRSVYEHVQELVYLAEHPEMGVESPQTLALKHMNILGIAPGTEGFHQMRLAIAMLAQDPALSLGKELYPMVCQRLGGGDPRTVEHNIRKAIRDAWEKREPELWKGYFPNCKGEKGPRNRDFLSYLALLVEQEQRANIRVRPL